MLTKQNEHLVPAMIKDMVDKYNSLPNDSNEKAVLRTRLELIGELIRKTLK